MGTKLLVLGFDGMDYNISLKFLPNLGFDVHPLYAPIPVTAPSWTSIHTGLTVEQHGINEMWKPAGKINHFFFWEILNQKGYTCELMNIPATYPPRPVRNYIVCGFPMPIRDGCYTYPPDLMNRLPRNFKERMDLVFWDSELRTNWFAKLRKTPLERLMARVIEDSNMILDKVVEFHSGGDLVYVQWIFIDRVGSHLFCKYHYGDLGALYRHSLYLIGRLEKELKPETEIVISDHGDGWMFGEHSHFGVIATKGFRLSKLLYENREVFNIILGLF